MNEADTLWEQHKWKSSEKDGCTVLSGNFLIHTSPDTEIPGFILIRTVVGTKSFGITDKQITELYAWMDEDQFTQVLREEVPHGRCFQKVPSSEEDEKGRILFKLHLNTEYADPGSILVIAEQILAVAFSASAQD